MATIKRGNLSFKEPPFKEGDRVTGGNYTQARSGTEICKDVKYVTVDAGNFVNCVAPLSWTVNGGNWSQKSFCGHEHPSWVKQSIVPACAEDCKHRIGTKKQWVDVDEKEYREEKNSLEPTSPSVRVVKVVDADGVTTQEFQKEVYIYEDGRAK
ncbi:hypothetical protein LCGC14_0235850 [marine sediment metagenome]|uniref:Uncharacterized protein n=1 Tax=marine sediment metagenome TaxID=412755 RepID=A0A0F9UDJ2_9ZZZZ